MRRKLFLGIMIGVIVLSIIGCSSESNTVLEIMDHDISIYEKKIAELEQQLKDTEEELKNYKVYEHLHIIDLTARRIINQIKAQEYETIKEQHGVEFEVLEDKIIFEGHEDWPFDTITLDSNTIHLNVIVGDENSVQMIYYTYVETAPMFAMVLDRGDVDWKLNRMYTGFR